ncbi:MAG: AMP-binding protein [Planctomycetota bacterium]
MTVETDVFACQQTMTLPRLLELRAARHPSRSAVTFLPDDEIAEESICLSYRELFQQATRVAASLQTALGVGDNQSAPEDAPRVLLLYPAGLDFLVGFIGAQIAGCIPVPTCFPKPYREMPRLNSAARDCRPIAILTDRDTESKIERSKLDATVIDAPILATDAAAADSASDADGLPKPFRCEPDSISFLQYTSGSTSEPKGVMVRQRNLISNLESIRRGFGLQWPADDATDGDPSIESGVFWLPFYHDMGLIGGILEALFIGGHSLLLSPRAFLQRPIRWLQAMSDYRATISGAPNFAYQLCVDRIPPSQTDSLKLDRWKIAFCGAEPISPRTLRDFGHRFADNGLRPNVFYPCYGLAEATLLVAGGDGPGEPKVMTVERSSFENGVVKVLDDAAAAQLRKRERHELVGCGSSVANTELRIVDPETLAPLDDGRIGEICVRGGGVTTGYWKPEASETDDRFDAEIAGVGGGFCRSGDLGFFRDSQLFVTGRVKDMIILRGRNLFPQDIESTVSDCVRSSHEKWNPGASTTTPMAVAFSVKGARSEALAIVSELPRGFDATLLMELSRRIRRAVIDVHDVDPQHIWLVRAASIPVTTSGKVRRSACRESFLDESMRTKHRYDRSSLSEQAPIAFPHLPERPKTSDEDQVRVAIEDWMSAWLVARAGVPPADVCRETPLADYGLDSMTAVELSGETEDWSGVMLTPEVAWDNPTIAKLSHYIATSYIAQRI